MFRLDREATKSGGLVTYVNNAWACYTTCVFAAEFNLQILIDICNMPVSGTVIDNNADNVVINKLLSIFISDCLSVLPVQNNNHVSYCLYW